MDAVAASPASAMLDRPGGIFIRRGEQMSEEDRSLLQTVARVVLQDDAGSLIEQVERRGRVEVPIAPFRPVRRVMEIIPSAEPQARDLAFFNGLGGFSRDGREYVTLLKPGSATPAPWVNVIANSQIGTVISESGSAYTWVDIPYPTRAAKPSICVMKKQGGSGHHLRCRLVAPVRISRGMDSATASSTTPKTGLPRNSASTSPSKRR